MMKKFSINLLTNVVLLLVGITLIMFHAVPNILVWSSRVIGAMFLLPAIAYLIMVAMRHADARTSVNYLGVLPAVGGLCFGIVMIIKASLFDGILQLMMGVLLIVLGLFHVIFLMLSRNSLNVKGWYFLCPIAVVLCGLLSLALPALRADISLVVLITGICLLLFNFTSLQEYIAERRARRAAGTISDDESPANETGLPANDSVVETTIQDNELE